MNLTKKAAGRKRMRKGRKKMNENLKKKKKGNGFHMDYLFLPVPDFL